MTQSKHKMPEGKLLKVIYLNSSELSEGLKCELEIEGNVLVAVEMYSCGSIRYVVVKYGMIEYILHGGTKE